MNDIEHLFFDLDHTLWDFDRNSALAFQKIFDKHQLTQYYPFFMDAYVPINFKYWEWYRNEKIDKETLRFGRLDDAFRALDVALEEDLINRLADDYIVHLPDNNHLFDGAIEVLDYLQQKYTLHIITNGFSEIQDRKLKNSKIADYFKTVTTADEVGVKKPHRRIFEHALKLAGARPSNSLMIGDNLEADIEGAEKLGLQTIYFDITDHSTYKGIKIEALDKLITLL